MKWNKSKKDKYHMISLICWILNILGHRYKDWWLLEAVGGKGEWNEYILNFIKEEKKKNKNISGVK